MRNIYGFCPLGHKLESTGAHLDQTGGPSYRLYADCKVCQITEELEQAIYFYGDICAQHQASLQFGGSIKTVDQRNKAIRESAKPLIEAILAWHTAPTGITR